MSNFIEKKVKCCRCGKFATWFYVPGTKDAPETDFFCDSHVSRGCSCNLIHIDDDYDGPDKFEELRDDQGRLLPCCEFSYSESGFLEKDFHER